LSSHLAILTSYLIYLYLGLLHHHPFLPYFVYPAILVDTKLWYVRISLLLSFLATAFPWDKNNNNDNLEYYRVKCYSGIFYALAELSNRHMKYQQSRQRRGRAVLHSVWWKEVKGSWSTAHPCVWPRSHVA
jgi:hypothetical protein